MSKFNPIFSLAGGFFLLVRNGARELSLDNGCSSAVVRTMA